MVLAALPQQTVDEPGNQLARWVEQVNQLETDFQSLTVDPSRRNLEAVQRGLRQVREHLNGTVLIESVNSSYRNGPGQHRLVAIDRLLSYGEHSELQKLLRPSPAQRLCLGMANDFSIRLGLQPLPRSRSGVLTFGMKILSGGIAVSAGLRQAMGPARRWIWFKC